MHMGWVITSLVNNTRLIATTLPSGIRKAYHLSQQQPAKPAASLPAHNSSQQPASQAAVHFSSSKPPRQFIITYTYVRTPAPKHVARMHAQCRKLQQPAYYSFSCMHLSSSIQPAGCMECPASPAQIIITKIIKEDKDIPGYQ